MNDINKLPHNASDLVLLDELRAIRREQAALRRLLDEFCRVFLNSKFPYGQPSDRWRRSA